MHDGFELVYPVWVLAGHGETGPVYACLTDSSGQSALLLFSDEDLANRFIDAERQSPSFAPIPMRDHEELTRLLDDMSTIANFVTIDSKDAVGLPTLRTWIIEHAQERIARQRPI